ncbi:hypothetical protein KNN17_20635 [Arthrobacter bambusae]|uniref:hypothetical protein n=1 Tax=Arthrobacter bambusae TaxID=1338426 RepID=UPI001F50B7A4|nr:hypothetical protein [Arthrobacter bambusae]MCI0143971.1 hypothetical protein [Arthrobacter bambusae]
MVKDHREPAKKISTFRRHRGRQITMAVWVVAAIGIGADLLLNGREAFDNVLIPWLAIISWMVFANAWLPRVTIAESGLEMCNGLLTLYIPFSAIEDLQNRYKVIIKAEGKKYVSQVSAPPGSNVVGSETYISVLDSTRTSDDDGGSLENLSNQDPVTTAWLNRRLASRLHGQRVTTRWNYPTIVIGAVLMLWFFAVALQLRPHGVS